MNESQTTINENEIVNQAELIGAIDKILIKESIARRVSDLQPLNGPVGIITGSKRDKDEDKLILSHEDIRAITRKIRTEFSVEAIKDLQSIYKENFSDFLATYIVDEMAYKIDKDFLLMSKLRAGDKGSLSFAGADFDNALWAVGQTIAIKVNKGLADLPISDNRSPKGWAVVSSNVASLLGGVLGDNTKDTLDDESPSYLGNFAGVEYYIDYTHPNDGNESVLFGIKGNGYSKGSTIFSHYITQWIEAVDANTGEPVFFALDRTGMGINPIDKEYYDGGDGVSGFLGKFSVDLSDLKAFS